MIVRICVLYLPLESPNFVDNWPIFTFKKSNPNNVFPQEIVIQIA